MDDVGDVVELEVGDVVGDEDDTDVGVLVGDGEGVEVFDEGVEVELLCELVGVDVGVLVDDDEGVELLCELALSIVLIALLRNHV